MNILRQFIKKILEENIAFSIDEAKIGHHEIGDDIAIFIKGNGDTRDMTLYDPKQNKVYGHVGIYKLPSGNWAVGGIAAERGYGPFLYELALTYVYPKALMPTRDGSVRGEAENVWKKFMLRSDVAKERINKGDSDFSQETYNDMGNGSDVRFIQTRYYYDGASDILNKLKKRMFEYLRAGVSLKDVDRMGNEYWMERYD